MKFDKSTLYHVESSLSGDRHTLYDLATWKNGQAFKKIDFSATGKPVIKIAELNNGIGSNTSFTKGNYGDAVALHWDDLLFSWSGNPQTSIDVFRFRLKDGWLNQHIFKVTANEQLVSKDFLYYILKYLKPFFTEIATNKQTTGLGHITLADLKRMSLIVPERSVQDRIVSILKSLDDKIEMNTKINKNLQLQAQAIYNHMIIDEADESWHQGLLSDVATITMGQSPKGDTYNEVGTGSVFFQGRAEFGFRFPTRRLYTIDPKRMAKASDVLMSVRAPVGDLNVAYEDCCIGRGLAAIRSQDNHQSFVLYTMFALRDQLDVFNGEGTVFGSINRESLNNMPIIIPPCKIIDNFESIVSPMDAAIRNNYEESCHLQAIRNRMLPRLMSGKLDASVIDL